MTICGATKAKNTEPSIINRQKPRPYYAVALGEIIPTKNNRYDAVGGLSSTINFLTSGLFSPLLLNTFQ